MRVVAQLKAVNDTWVHVYLGHAVPMVLAEYTLKVLSIFKSQVNSSLALVHKLGFYRVTCLLSVTFIPGFVMLVN